MTGHTTSLASSLINSCFDANECQVDRLLCSIQLRYVAPLPHWRIIFWMTMAYGTNTQHAQGMWSRGPINFIVIIRQTSPDLLHEFYPSSKSLLIYCEARAQDNFKVGTMAWEIRRRREKKEMCLWPEIEVNIGKEQLPTLNSGGGGAARDRLSVISICIPVLNPQKYFVENFEIISKCSVRKLILN